MFLCISFISAIAICNCINMVSIHVYTFTHLGLFLTISINQIFKVIIQLIICSIGNDAYCSLWSLLVIMLKSEWEKIVTATSDLCRDQKDNVML